ncbi:hypothetical protein VH1709_contig00060-0006 [Vibrio harveyi]|uniref:hypothetical protein n=2 Tax=Vibrio harveyi TaxID=669 RepID=UPI000D99973C|nr:hypothetical protein [Vibrio harveyi]GBL01060.1 hypothetical protein VH1709_contig00060-0006 [Vibrio harveyi]
MIGTIKKAFGALLVLWGVLLSCALVQVAQFVTSSNDARDYAIANYIASHPYQPEQAIIQAVQHCLKPPLKTDSLPLPPPTQPISVYECLRQQNQPKLAIDIQTSDSAMQSVAWPLSLFW